MQNYRFKLLNELKAKLATLEAVVEFKRVIPLLVRAVVASMVVIAISLHPLL